LSVGADPDGPIGGWRRFGPDGATAEGQTGPIAEAPELAVMAGRRGRPLTAEEVAEIAEQAERMAERLIASANAHRVEVETEVRAAIAPHAGRLFHDRADIKGLASLEDKIQNRYLRPDAVARKGVTTALAEVEERMNDVLRFAVELPLDEYSPAVLAIRAQMEADGFHFKKAYNPYADIGTPAETTHRGINDTYLTRDGELLFEVQYHTPESLAAWDEGHKDYEIERDRTRSRFDRDQAMERMIRRANQVPIPDGAQWIPKK
ncbi:MAG: hypothetical protein ABMB14_36020, partial [Myxococcota bacterium]